MCGIRPSAHCAPNRLSSSRAARRGAQCCRPERDERRVPAPLVRIQSSARGPSRARASSRSAPGPRRGQLIDDQSGGPSRVAVAHDHASLPHPVHRGRQHLVGRPGQSALVGQFVGRSRWPTAPPAIADQSMWPAPGSSRLLSLSWTCRIQGRRRQAPSAGRPPRCSCGTCRRRSRGRSEPICWHSAAASARVLIMWFS